MNECPYILCLLLLDLPLGVDLGVTRILFRILLKVDAGVTVTCCPSLVIARQRIAIT
jgi:hypothetical protein